MDNSEIFRKKNLDRLNSPEELNDYIRVTNPGVWILILSVVAFLVAICIWGAFGTIESAGVANVHVETGVIYCFVDQSVADRVEPGMTVEFADCEGEILSVGQTSDGTVGCILKVDNAPAPGIYSGKVLIKKIRPFTLITN